MLKAYINYQNPHISTHRTASCGQIQPHAAQGQRYRRITIVNLSAELRVFVDRGHSFAAQQRLNDMWLELNLKDDALEEAVLEFIRKSLAARYTPVRELMSSLTLC